MAKGPNAFRTISEAADELGVPQHVLRFWETKFSFIRPMKRAGGRRFYRPQDIAVLSGVRALLHAEGYTIKGVQKLHREQGLTHVIAAGLGDNGSASLDALAVASLDSLPRGDLADEARDRLVLALDDLQAVKARLDGLLRGA
ncbi:MULTISPECIES: MerR family transcriptional regulator [Caulobacter]|uniref:DNA-binding transcriptional MerR regulator n=1 Tax=Caulobacter rhizosphaerae TaxID=2010972 RepID=A0ABU1MTT5_9CAUL|nr:MULTISPECIES: MerR family transcriptional regulator [Caulobacter]KQZ21933.1 MerR family transcriptional regulator [Caulobacter sp. Root1472]MDR6529604.1 DNA-binding transcriptional MerR regulator [Caulobacter rhizosphaerae]GGL24724.1 MerR family transcriptional regulator [Caulobacter rhizosphaerae]